MVPPQGRERVLVKLHSGHPGITRMKGLMRGLVWWPGIDTDVEKLVKNVHLVNRHKPHLPWRRCTHGNGLSVTLISLAQLKERCYCSL